MAMFPGVGTTSNGMPCSPVGPQQLASPNLSGDSSQGQYSYMVNSLGLVPSSVALYASNNDRNPIQSAYSTHGMRGDGVDMSRPAFIPYGMPAMDGSILPDTTTSSTTTNMKEKKGSGKHRGMFGIMKTTQRAPGSNDHDENVFSVHRKTKKCDICGDVLTEDECSPSGNKKAMCEVCRKFLVRMQALEQMKREVEPKKLLRCETCQKGYASLTTLKTHMRVHIGTKCFKCTFCDRNFLYEGNLRTHLRVHTGEKPYTCDECGKCFSQSGTLKKHIRMHTGEKPYKCDICDKAFAYSENLIPHKRVHSQERPFVCPVCDKAYSQPGSLKSHLKVVHNSTTSNNEASEDNGMMASHSRMLEDDTSGDGRIMTAVERSNDDVVTGLEHIVG